MSKHTPGPWEAVGQDIVAGAGLRVGTAYMQDVGHERAVVNARFIAAAPEMLANLYIDAADSCEAHAPPRCECYVCRARSLLSSITGEA